MVFGAGRYDIEQIAGGGRNKSTYALVNYRREELGRLQRLFFENHLRRVKDDIADEFSALVERPKRIDTDFRGLVAGQQALFHQQFPRRPATVSQQLRQRHLPRELAQSLGPPSRWSTKSACASTGNKPVLCPAG